MCCAVTSHHEKGSSYCSATSRWNLEKRCCWGPDNCAGCLIKETVTWLLSEMNIWSVIFHPGTTMLPNEGLSQMCQSRVDTAAEINKGSIWWAWDNEDTLTLVHTTELITWHTFIKLSILIMVLGAAVFTLLWPCHNHLMGSPQRSTTRTT